MIAPDKIAAMENWLFKHARPLEIAKWKFIFQKGTKEELINELTKYQNPDGGFGNGLESDILTPESNAISSAEAIFTALDFGLDLKEEWANNLMKWLENTISSTPSFWEPVPPSLELYPHPSWWNYHPDTEFSPNPSAVCAAALLDYGTAAQQILGEKAACRCVDFILSDQTFLDHDTYCLQRLFLALAQKSSPLITPGVRLAMEQRILKGACTDASQWKKYVAQPLDLIPSPSSFWYGLLAEYIPANLDYLEETLLPEGFWQPNFSWNMDTAISRRAEQYWKGYIIIKNVRLLHAFGRLGIITC